MESMTGSKIYRRRHVCFLAAATTACCLLVILPSVAASFQSLRIQHPSQRKRSISHRRSAPWLLSSKSDNGVASSVKQDLLELINTVPKNSPTPAKLTDSILKTVRDMENECPTNNDEVLTKLSGNWELLWTAQDASSDQVKQLGVFRSWINPLENQSYSNNPLSSTTGRANPILPREIQDRLEGLGILTSENVGNDDDATPPVRSSQAIDLKKQRVRNVVSFRAGPKFTMFGGGSDDDASLVRGSIIVDVKFKPNGSDKRRVDVKFDSCRVSIKNLPSINFPLGPIGPTGWLRTVYIDDSMRITRGHKGSVFVLLRPSQRL